MIVCLVVLHDQDDLNRTYEEVFRARLAAERQMADCIAAWAVGEITDEGLEQGLLGLGGNEGSAVSWFLIAERRAAHGEHRAALAAYLRSCECGSHKPQWASGWARERLNGYTETSPATAGP